jgi:uncharacterized protein YjiS (DUF1127 family)
MRMSHVRAPISPRFSDIRSGAVGGFSALAKKVASDVWAWLRECQARASERRVLARLTDWELRDIGISRVEADAEAKKWFWFP